MITKVIKRDGRVVDFDSGKILAAIEKSMKAAGLSGRPDGMNGLPIRGNY